MRNILILLTFLMITNSALCQKTERQPVYFAEPIISDSTSTIMIPIRYSYESFSSSKIGNLNDFYANIVFYDFQKDTSKKLFAEDSYIERFTPHADSYLKYNRVSNQNNICENWIFYFVKTTDSNKNGKIDHGDASVLFVSDRFGNNLKPITSNSESAVSIEIFDKQGIALIRIQRDLNKDLTFDSKDNDFYYVRLDLSTLLLGNKIEIK